MYVTPLALLEEVEVIVIGVDTETTGLDIKKDRIIEVAWCLWDTERKLPVKMSSYMIGDDLPISKEVEGITKIRRNDLQQWGVDLKVALKELSSDMTKASAVVAHNGHSFDYPLLDAEFSRCSISSTWIRKIDTMMDLPREAYGRSAILSYMAADHGFINPFPHRALTDVLTMLTIMARYDIGEVYERALSKRLIVRAMSTYDQNFIVKQHGFRWQEAGGCKFEKAWVKVCKECDLPELEKSVPFKIARLKELT